MENLELKTASEMPARKFRSHKPTHIAHIVLRSNQVAEMTTWYASVFEAKSVFNNGQLAFLYFDDEHHRIAIASVPELGEPAANLSGFDHVAFSYKSIGDLLETYGRLATIGIKPFFSVDHGPTTSLYYKDPDGNQIELQVDNFGSQEEAHAYFKSDSFAKNPIGIEIDPSLLLERYMQGAEDHLLLSSGTRRI